jgi:hypothetical protein
VRVYATNYQYFIEHHVEGVFTELEFEILADMRDYKVWMMAKLLENPRADTARLTQTFTDGFYGPAGGSIREYLMDLEAAWVARQPHCDWNSTPWTLTYLDLPFINQAQRLFDQAEAAVAGDAVLLRRVRHARLPLDRATVVLYPWLKNSWKRSGEIGTNAPPDRMKTARRALETWREQTRIRLTTAAQAAEIQRAEGELERYLLMPEDVTLPEKFRNYPKEDVFDFTAVMTRNFADEAKVVKDTETESGMANHLDLASGAVGSSEKYVLPMGWGVYDVNAKKGVLSGTIQAGDVSGPGYHWYRLGSVRLQPGMYVYFFWSWIIQVDLNSAYEPDRPDDLFEIWGRVRFTGPRFPHAQPDARDAIDVERIILIRQKSQSK